MNKGDFKRQLLSPPRKYSLMPFWFWNDQLDEQEIVRQIGDFQDRGVHGFVIHPRVGLPKSIPFMSDEMLGFMDVAIGEAQRREMHVLYQWRTLVPTYEERTTSIRGVQIRYVRVGKTATPIRILGDERQPVHDVWVDNITIGTVRGTLIEELDQENQNR